VNLTIGYTELDQNDSRPQDFDDTQWAFIKVGISRRWNSHGKTNIAVQYAQVENRVSDGDDTDAWGIAIVQKIDSAALELYAAYTHYEYDDNTVGLSYQDMDFILLGTRMKF